MSSAGTCVLIVVIHGMFMAVQAQTNDVQSIENIGGALEQALSSMHDASTVFYMYTRRLIIDVGMALRT